MHIKISDSASNRTKDKNGFLIVKNNPIAKAGVFDYYLKEIDKDSDSEEIVKVFRSFDDLEKNKDLFIQKPIMYEHKWVGEDENKADGAIGSEVRAVSPYLYADLIIYNPELIEKIESGEIVEISPGYEAKTIKQGGSYDGVDYQYLQKLESVNHIAVVPQGRSGSDLRIKDKGIKSMKSKILDMFMNRYKDDDSVDKRDLIKQVLAIAEIPNDEFEGGEDEKFDKILGLIEKIGYDKSERSEDDDKIEVEDEDKDKDEKVEDDNDNSEKDDDDSKDNKTMDDGLSREDIIKLIRDVVSEEVKKSISKVEDKAINESKKIMDAYNRVSSAVGHSFNSLGMSESDVYAYGYEVLSKNKLDKTMDSKTAFNIVAVTKGVHKVEDSSSKKSNVLDMLNKVNRR